MKTINLTKGKVAIIDDEDYENIAQYPWCAMHNPNGNWYAVRRERKTSRFVLMHREIAGAIPGQQVDHINLDGLDNRRCNLRICTSRQNRYNAPKRRNKLVDYKGVSIKRPGRYFAQIKLNGKQIHLGTFSNPIEAAKAYDQAARELFGEFAYTNFPEEK